MLRDLSYQKIVRNKEELLKHVKSFKIEPKFSAGIWYFSPAASRFHEKYKEDRTIEERLGIVYRLYDNKVVDGSFRLEAHYPNEINWDNIDLYRSLRKETGIRMLTVVPNLFTIGILNLVPYLIHMNMLGKRQSREQLRHLK